MTANIEILSVGNELLIGKVLNTNAQWLAKRLTVMGLNVRRITVAPDDVEEISNVVKEIINRKPDILITTGGLGPTFDDKTLEGIAKALDTILETNPKALQMIEEKYRNYAKERGLEKIELTTARVKMANLPKNAVPLPNPLGTAPGMIIKYKKVKVVALPGVPPEMKAIFDESLVPMLKRLTGNVTFYETSLGVSGIMESELAPIIDKVMHDNPYVYIKSHPRGAEKTPHIELHLSTTAKNPMTARNYVTRALIQINDIIQTKGGKTKPFKTKPK
ncbi:MAG: nicotinamide mononucleotide deamidase-related protein [Candidatus Bathyarchaeales archaeon]